MLSIADDVPPEFIVSFMTTKPRSTLKQAQVFWIVANNPMISTKDLMEKCGLVPRDDQHTFSKVVNRLGRGNSRTSGYGLIKGFEDSTDYRAKLYKLTSEGEAVFNLLMRGVTQ